MSDNIIEVKITQTDKFKNLFLIMKDMLYYVNLIFDKDGIKLHDKDPSNQLLINFTLNSSSFEKYYCEEKTIVRINIALFLEHIKDVSKTDTLTLFIEKSDVNNLKYVIESCDCDC